MAWNVIVVSLRQQIIPDDLVSRTFANPDGCFTSSRKALPTRIHPMAMSPSTNCGR